MPGFRDKEANRLAFAAATADALLAFLADHGRLDARQPRRTIKLGHQDGGVIWEHQQGFGLRSTEPSQDRFDWLNAQKMHAFVAGALPEGGATHHD
jgi:hypothetical protein